MTPAPPIIMGNPDTSETVSPDKSPPTTTSLNLLDKLYDSDTPPRLGIDVGRRLPLTSFAAFSVGMALGASHGAKQAAYQFRAENAHRFPTSPTGWFLYHKTKNYKAIVGAVKDGAKLGLKLGAGAMAFCLFEETVDYARHDRRDFLSTVIAGLSFSGVYSLLGENLDLSLPFLFCSLQSLSPPTQKLFFWLFHTV